MDAMESLRPLLDSMPDVAFFMKDKHGRGVMYNRRYCEDCKVADEEALIGRTDYHLFEKGRAEQYKKSDEIMSATAKPIFNTIEIGPEDSDRAIIYSKVPVRDKKGKLIGFAGFYRFLDTHSHITGFYRRFTHAMDYIHEHFAEQIAVKEITRMTGVSERQLGRSFVKFFGVSPKEYILRLRVNAARELLETTDNTLTDIAQTVGFYDHSHLTRTFKRMRGITPEQYRKKHKSL